MDNLPLQQFYNYVSFLEQMIDAQEKALADMKSRR